MTRLQLRSVATSSSVRFAARHRPAAAAWRHASSRRRFCSQPPAGPNPRVFFDVSIGGAAARRVTLELRADKVPKTAENFRQLCTGEAGNGREGNALHFKANLFHRIIPGFMAQAGDITLGDGRGGESIFGYKFEDENFALQHTEAGLLSMANSGRNTNSSQFFLTFDAAPWLNGKHCVFGSVVDGMDLLRDIEACGAGDGRPTTEVQIVDCGELGGGAAAEQLEEE